MKTILNHLLGTIGLVITSALWVLGSAIWTIWQPIALLAWLFRVNN